ncbi:MAG: GNAT family N-acetyltransferase [Saprospiraceae bacterium]|mgnify:CR=1 FL=1|nr:GNAT family N-acetyltransferase [Saprospiraceae bacterium]MCB9327204.1 GNAT family N-acetyltransferase [Lewinellaceae bacterium]
MEDKDYFYNQATDSDASPFWYGSNPNEKLPDKQTFFKYWSDTYFENEKDQKGRCFHIMRKGQSIGMISYRSISMGQVEVDILIYNKENWNHGYGTSAIKLLSKYLSARFHVDEVWININKDNARAIKAYEKAGYMLFPSEKAGYEKLVKKFEVEV